MKNNLYRILYPLLALTILYSCKDQPASSAADQYTTTLSFKAGEEAKIIEAFLSAKDSTHFKLGPGIYHFDNLSLAQLKNIFVEGNGYDTTILDFSAQSAGGEGIRVTDLVGFTIKGMTIRDSKGDLLKINKSSNVVIQNVHATWKNSDSTNGGYALYPVLCKNILIENCYVQGSSDAGIYVGQSDSAIVRSCKAYKNVAGCEIENTTHAAVYNNEFYGNTAGFLIFDLPGLSKRGGYTQAYDNNIHDNNERNFAKSGSFGSVSGVGMVAPGSGVWIISVSHVDLYNNRIVNNNTNAITIASGVGTNDKALSQMNDNYFPFSQHINIHDNEMAMQDSFPAPTFDHHIGKIFVSIEKSWQLPTPVVGINESLLLCTTVFPPIF